MLLDVRGVARFIFIFLSVPVSSCALLERQQVTAWGGDIYLEPPAVLYTAEARTSIREIDESDPEGRNEHPAYTDVTDVMLTGETAGLTLGLSTDDIKNSDDIVGRFHLLVDYSHVRFSQVGRNDAVELAFYPEYATTLGVNLGACAGTDWYVAACVSIYQHRSVSFYREKERVVASGGGFWMIVAFYNVPDVWLTLNFSEKHRGVLGANSVNFSEKDDFLDSKLTQYYLGYQYTTE